MPHERPSPDELREFLAGRLVGGKAERIEEFLANDPAALAALEESAGAAEFSESFGAVAEIDPGESDHHLTGVIEKLKVGDFSPLSVEEQARRVLDAPMGAGGEPGRLGKFEIVELIAAGGMGLVFRAHDPDLQREVAIKTLSSRLAVDEDSRGRFLKEARSVALLEHPNILPIHAVEEGDHVPFIVMPLVGKTLADLVAEEGPLEPRRAARLLEQAARALAEAHAKGIVHRDIKPANLLLDEDGVRVFVADFGIAQQGDDDGQGLGTPAFAAPEQIAGEEVTPQSDLYALGSTLHFALTGEPPRINVRVRGSKWLGSLVADLRQTDPARRPASADMVARRLRRGLRKTPRRRATVLSLLSALSLAVVVAAFTPLGLSGWANRATGWLNGEHFFLDGRFGTFESLAEAAEAARGDVVLIDFDGERAMGSFRFEHEQPLTIHSAAGRRPVLVQTDHDPIITSTAALNLEGLVLVRPDPEQGVGFLPIVRTIDAPLSLQRCGVFSFDDHNIENAPISMMSATSELTIADCVIYSGPVRWLRSRGSRKTSEAQEFKIRISDSIIIGAGADLLAHRQTEFDIEFERVTALGELLVSTHANRPLLIRSKQCVLGLSDSVIWMQGLRPEQDPATYLAWSAEGNAYSGRALNIGFVQRGEVPDADQYLTPARWQTLPYASEIRHKTIGVTEFPIATRSLPELRQALGDWTAKNRPALENAAPSGADVPALLHDSLGIRSD